MAKINGIQQMGVGVSDVHAAWKWYRENLGMDICVFEEAAKAELMLPHTEGNICERHAVLALNMEGGGGFEIWQHTGKKPAPIPFEVQLGDLGICVTKLKTDNIEKAYKTYKQKDMNVVTEISEDPSGNKHFYLRDIYGYVWEIVQEKYVFKSVKKAVNGGVFGAVIGCKDIEESFKVYRDILGYNKVVYDETKHFEDWKGVPGSGNTYRRVLLKKEDFYPGAFSPLLGPSVIELVQVQDREPKDIFEGRIWGDPGFIHLCFDVVGMDELREEVKEKGFPFTVDTGKAMDTFDMGDAAGNFAYIQAPEGTLIEFVETHKVPLAEKFGLFIDLRKRGQDKPLPNWLLKLFSVKRVK